MRITLDLDEDIVTLLATRSSRLRVPMSTVASDLMRSALVGPPGRVPLASYAPPTFDTGKPMVDVTCTAGVLQGLETRD
jgi:hypothetical protein